MKGGNGGGTLLSPGEWTEKEMPVRGRNDSPKASLLLSHSQKGDRRTGARRRSPGAIPPPLGLGRRFLVCFISGRFLVGVLAAVLLAPAAPAAPPARNVVILLADDLGYADVGYHGCKDVATPHIDSIAAAGVRFTNGYVTAAVCGPTRAGLLSGRYQQGIGCEQNIGTFRRSPDVKLGLPLEVKTMADRFKALGFATGCFGKWHLGGERAFDTSLFPTSRGFYEFFGFLEGAASYVDHTNKEKKS